MDLTSKHRKTAVTINIGKQIGRNDNNDDVEVLNAEEGQIYYDPAMEENLHRVPVKVKGGVVWNKMTGRDNNNEDIRKLNMDTFEDQELILDPSNHSSSKSKKVITGPEWRSQKTDRFVYESRDEDEQELILENNDAGK